MPMLQIILALENKKLTFHKELEIIYKFSMSLAFNQNLKKSKEASTKS